MSRWLVLMLCACAETTVGEGASLVSDPTLGGDFNPFSCATCHATSESDERLLSGYSLLDSAFRPSYWGGYERTLLEAINFCVQYFMGGSPIDADSVEGKAIYQYLVEISPTNPAAALPLTVVENISTVARGDPGCGEVVYENACAPCHGAAHTGDGKLDHPTLAAIVLPEWTAGYKKDFPKVDPALVVIEKVRHGQFFSVGGNMPFFSREALSDADLGALLAFLEL